MNDDFSRQLHHDSLIFATCRAVEERNFPAASSAAPRFPTEYQHFSHSPQHYTLVSASEIFITEAPH